MVDECKQNTTTSSTYAKKGFQVNIFHDGMKAYMDLYRHCIYPGSYLKYAFSIKEAKYDNLSGNPLINVTLLTLHNYPWVMLLHCTAFQWWCHSAWGLLLVEKGIPKLRTDRGRNTMKPVYNDHLMGYFSAFWSSSRWPLGHLDELKKADIVSKSKLVY